VGAPFEVAEIFVHAYRTKRPPWGVREIRNDNGGVPLHRDHGVSLIDGALPDALARVCMHVGEDLEFIFPAILPERGMAYRMESDCTRLVRFGIEVVIADVCRHSTRYTGLRPQQKGTAFGYGLASAPQLENKLRPKQ
jgi:hypothetical protein